MKENIHLESNALSGSIPSELGALSKMTGEFYLFSNRLCGAIPSEVSALSTQVTSGKWDVAPGNNFGPTPCSSTSALSSLYFSTAGVSWYTKTDWMSGGPCTAAWCKSACLYFMAYSSPCAS